MKLKAAFLAIALATASATSAGSATLATAPIPTSMVASAVQEDMTECQMEQYIRCMRSSGDHGYCVDQAMAQVCRR